MGLAVDLDGQHTLTAQVHNLRWVQELIDQAGAGEPLERLLTSLAAYVAAYTDRHGHPPPGVDIPPPPRMPARTPRFSSAATRRASRARTSSRA
jgi:hypothetical protein